MKTHIEPCVPPPLDAGECMECEITDFGRFMRCRRNDCDYVLAQPITLPITESPERRN